MRIERDFGLPVPPDRAFEALTDAREIAAVVPGATLTSWDGTTFEAAIRVRLGPLPVVARGRGRLVTRDPAARRALVEATRRDGSRVAEIDVAVRPDAHGMSRVRLGADVRMPPAAGRLGRSLASDVGNRVLDEAIAALTARLAGEVAPAGAAGAGLVSRLPGLALSAAEVGAGVTLAVVRRVLGRGRP